MRVIAEVGSNWKTHDDCIHSVRMAKYCGADAVKFQYFTHKDLYGVEGKAESLPNIRALGIEAAALGIEFMCTGFSPAAYRKINEWVIGHKIASSEITDEDILKTVNSFEKPVVLSTGGASFDEIDRALDLLDDCPVTLMYCVVAYPARVIDFRHLSALKTRYGRLVKYGYSDHSTDILVVPKLARGLGSEILEKHVNFTGHTDTPDAPHSLSTEEFKMMIDGLRFRLPNPETLQTNPWKRKMITLPDGTRGYYRPLPSAG